MTERPVTERRVALAAIVSAAIASKNSSAAGVQVAGGLDPSTTNCCAVVELRQYTLRAKQRDVLMELFERKFIEPQNAVGSRVLGQFRDVDDPDRFVWIRGFDDMVARARALDAFYGGSVWKENRSLANATIVDSDNVLLLKPIGGASFGLRGRVARKPSSLVLASIHYMEDAQLIMFSQYFERHVRERLQASGAEILATLVSETAQNSFPKLPVRTKDRVFVSLAHFDGPDLLQSYIDARRSESGSRDDVAEELLPAFMRKPELLTLAPTTNSGIY